MAKKVRDFKEGILSQLEEKVQTFIDERRECLNLEEFEILNERVNVLKGFWYDIKELSQTDANYNSFRIIEDLVKMFKNENANSFQFYYAQIQSEIDTIFYIDELNYKG